MTTCDLSSGQCPRCNRRGKTHWKRQCRLPGVTQLPDVKTSGGPGTELHNLLHSLGFAMGGCSCQAWLNKMNTWAVAGCVEHRAEIIEHLESQASLATLTEKLKAGALALANGLPLSIGGLVDEAIARASRD